MFNTINKIILLNILLNYFSFIALTKSLAFLAFSKDYLNPYYGTLLFLNLLLNTFFIKSPMPKPLLLLFP